jgi:GcrA cell cycle regulator
MASWTDDRQETLRKLWEAGLSAIEIAEALGGITRDSVLGKVHRLGLSEYRAPHDGRRHHRHQASVSMVAMRLEHRRLSADIVQPESVKAGIEPLLVSFDDLRRGMCKYPYGERAPFAFCGHPAVANKPYCQAHLDVTYQKGTQQDFDRVAKACMGGVMHTSKTTVME